MHVYNLFSIYSMHMECNVNLDAHCNDFINENEIVNKIFKIVISNILHHTNAWVYIQPVILNGKKKPAFVNKAYRELGLLKITFNLV